MSKPGRKPMTKEQHAARGQTRPSEVDRPDIVEFPLVAEVPAPPDWVAIEGEHAVEMWNRMAPLLYQQRVMSVTDEYSLGHMCVLHETILRMRGAASAADKTQLRQYFGEFGMTPASRQRITAPKPDKQGGMQKREKPTGRSKQNVS